MKQRTIGRSFKLSGIGLHSGKTTEITVKPASENTGIVINNAIVDISLVHETRRGTTLGQVAVVEHFLAAAYGLGVDNLRVSVEGGEVPALDGSSLPFVEAMEAAQIIEQKSAKIFLRLAAPLKIIDGENRLEAYPFDGFSLGFMINFPVVGEQRMIFDFSSGSFKAEIAPARTFGYLEELAELKKQGLGLGASIENALAVSEKGYLNEPRFKDEMVRHKLLDLIGDLALLGRPLKARIVAHKTGHRHNIELVRRLLKNG